MPKTTDFRALARNKKAAKKVVQRNKRPAIQLVADLKAERARVEQVMADRLSKLDQRIEAVSTRYSTSISVQTMSQEKTLDELQQELAQSKKQQKLLRLALKTK